MMNYDNTNGNQPGHGALGVESTSTFWRLHMEEGFFESLKHAKQDLSIIEFENQV